MKAVILAAGEGSRMRPLTYTRPKVMLPIANRPILEHLLLEAKQAGIGEFVFVVGYCHEQVRAYFGNGKRWGVNIVYRRQARQLGTADAVRMAEGLIDENFLVLNGDAIINRDDIRRLAEKSQTCISTLEVKDPSGYGILELKNGKVVKIHEKSKTPPGRTANAGLYLFTPDIFRAISLTPKSPRGEYEITDSLQLLLGEGKDICINELHSWLDLSYPWDLLEANERLMSGLEAENLGEVEENVVLKGPVRIGKNSTVKAGAYIVGPVIIGEGCDIGPNCFIRPSTAIGDNCHVGNAVEVKNTIAMKGTRIPHLNYIGDSVIGEGCNFGAGTKVANLRLDDKNVRISGIDTGRRKLGAIIGDSVNTGINSSINIGTTIGNNCFIGPGAVASGVILPNSTVF